ncbi:MAG: hypothetical protein IPK16_07020 [Anaerolineales bacterium]|nr:hypothetical protein [Anaerolineales bacterium]
MGAGLLAAAVLLAPRATAQTGGSYTLRATIASGGAIAGGAYRLNNAMGQSTAGVTSGGSTNCEGASCR